MEDLKLRRYVAVIDKSGSMGEPSKKGSSQSRWAYAQETVTAFARKVEEIGGTLDVYTFNNSYNYYPGAGANKVSEIFRNESPMGGTNFVPVMSDAFSKHFAQGAKPTTIMVLTDGEPSEGVNGQRALAKLIVDTTKKMEGDSELGVGFIQVGDDPKATAFLKTLDDDLQGAGAKFDIVDSKTVEDLENQTVEQILLNAVND